MTATMSFTAAGRASLQRPAPQKLTDHRQCACSNQKTLCRAQGKLFTGLRICKNNSRKC